jgi:pimeloyl-ACP methyl ester carboxylesterase
MSDRLASVVPMQPSDERVKVDDGVYLHVRCWPAPGRPYLLVHGLSSNARLWDETAARLAAAGHAAHAVDLRSHGDSDAPPGGYDTLTAAADLARIDIDDAIVVGQSWGGNVAVAYAATHPEMVAALALVDGGWIDLPAEFPDWATCEEALRPPEIDGLPAAQLDGFLRSAHPDWSEAAIRATVANLRVWPDGTLGRRLSIPRHMQIVRSMWEQPPQQWYAAVTAPVLLIPALPADPQAAEAKRAQVRAAAAQFADADVREYPAADHDLHAQHPQSLADDLLALADRVAA